MAVLLVSELVSNAVLHAGTDIEVVVRVLPDRLAVEVHDQGGGQAVRRRYSNTVGHRPGADAGGGAGPGLGHGRHRGGQVRVVRARPGLDADARQVQGRVNGVTGSGGRRRPGDVRIVGLPVRRLPAGVRARRRADAGVRPHRRRRRRRRPGARRGARPPHRPGRRAAGPVLGLHPPAGGRAGRGRGPGRTTPSTSSTPSPPEAVQAAAELGALLDEADEFCRDGRPAHPGHPAARRSPSGAGSWASSSARPPGEPPVGLVGLERPIADRGQGRTGACPPTAASSMPPRSGPSTTTWPPAAARRCSWPARPSRRA